MIDIVVDGLTNSGPPELERWVPKRIQKALESVPKEITDNCYITVRKSTRSPVNNLSIARPSIRLIGEISDDDIIAIAEALAPMTPEFEIRVMDDGSVDDVKEYLAMARML